jgi:hypothetical protein
MAVRRVSTEYGTFPNSLVNPDDLSRYRQGHGAKNIAVLRRFALDLVGSHKSKGSVKTRRKLAGWNPDFLLACSRSHDRYPGLFAVGWPLTTRLLLWFAI